MRIAIISDTHLPKFGGRLPRALIDGFAQARIERIVHAGDWTEPMAVELLEAIANVDGVAGNNDGPALHARFGTQLVLSVDGARLGVTHGHLGPGATTRDRAVQAFADQPGLDAIVFGHSHAPLVERLDRGTWLVNPGSPTDRRHQPLFTCALMTIEGGSITSVELQSYTDRSA